MTQSISIVEQVMLPPVKSSLAAEQHETKTRIQKTSTSTVAKSSKRVEYQQENKDTHCSLTIQYNGETERGWLKASIVTEQELYLTLADP